MMPSEVLPLPDPVRPRFADIPSIIAAGCKPEMPSLVPFGDGALLYSGRINEVHGEPGGGKSWVALFSAHVTMEAGGNVIYIDPEDSEPGIVGRLLSMGASPEVLAERLFLCSQPEPSEIPGLAAWAQAQRPRLVILDGLAEMLAAQGLSEIDAGEVLGFFRQSVRPFASCGAAVLVTDHVIKDREARGKWMRGSGAKLGRYDGASYVMTSVKSFSRTTAGLVRLSVAKDRCGGVGSVGLNVADIHFKPGDGGSLHVSITPSSHAEWKPTIIMERLSEFLESTPGATKTLIRAGVTGRGEKIDQALRELIHGGFVRVEQVGQASHHYSQRPYRDLSEVME